MPETSAPDPPAAGAVKTDGDKVYIYDGRQWVHHERLADFGPGSVLRGDDGDKSSKPAG